MLRKVLIVEDSSLQAKMYRMVFGSFPGCEQIFANNGLEALNKLAIEKDIDLIISDINMPQMDGISFLKAMQDDGYGHIPVIVISTTQDDDHDIRKALELGAKGYLKKPWKPSSVVELINRIVQNN
ncbi:response regulator [bacterium]|nr:response regulator [bacterium]